MDLSGRGGYYEELAIPTEKIGAFDTQLVYEFMWAFAANARLTLHLRKLAGRNSHHIVEGAFKALGRGPAGGGGDRSPLPGRNSIHQRDAVNGRRHAEGTVESII